MHSNCLPNTNSYGTQKWNGAHTWVLTFIFNILIWFVFNDQIDNKLSLSLLIYYKIVNENFRTFGVRVCLCVSLYVCLIVLFFGVDCWLSISIDWRRYRVTRSLWSLKIKFKYFFFVVVFNVLLSQYQWRTHACTHTIIIEFENELLTWIMHGHWEAKGCITALWHTAVLLPLYLTFHSRLGIFFTISFSVTLCHFSISVFQWSCIVE